MEHVYTVKECYFMGRTIQYPLFAKKEDVEKMLHNEMGLIPHTNYENIWVQPEEIDKLDPITNYNLPEENLLNHWFVFETKIVY